MHRFRREIVCEFRFATCEVCSLQVRAWPAIMTATFGRIDATAICALSKKIAASKRRIAFYVEKKNEIAVPPMCTYIAKLQ